MLEFPTPPLSIPGLPGKAAEYNANTYKYLGATFSFLLSFLSSIPFLLLHFLSATNFSFLAKILTR